MMTDTKGFLLLLILWALTNLTGRLPTVHRP